MTAEGRFCTFYLDGLCFAIAVERVQEATFLPAITPVPLASRAVAGLSNLRGQIVTVIDLPRCLGVKARSAATLPAMLIVRSENFPVGLLVDELGEVVQVRNTYAKFRRAIYRRGCGEAGARRLECPAPAARAGSRQGSGRR